jgi:hypothetical protein
MRSAATGSVKNVTSELISQCALLASCGKNWTSSANTSLLQLALGDPAAMIAAAQAAIPIAPVSNSSTLITRGAAAFSVILVGRLPLVLRSADRSFGPVSVGMAPAPRIWEARC